MVWTRARDRAGTRAKPLLVFAVGTWGIAFLAAFVLFADLGKPYWVPVRRKAAIASMVCIFYLPHNSNVVAHGQ